MGLDQQQQPSRSYSKMNGDGNIQCKSNAEDMGAGFRKWANDALNYEGDESNSFLSRGTIMEFLKKKKEGKINGGMHGGHSPRRSDKLDGGGGSNHSRKVRRNSTMDDSEREAMSQRRSRSGTSPMRKTPSRSKTMGHEPDDYNNMDVSPTRRRNRDFRPQRADPTKQENRFKKRQYKVGIKPHQNADGIMR